MDYSNERPQRLWVLRPDTKQHLDTEMSWCAHCNDDLEPENAIPVPMLENEPLCRSCAIKNIKSKAPVTVEYMTWLDQGDMRWWSPWFCNCEGCTG